MYRGQQTEFLGARPRGSNQVTVTVGTLQKYKDDSMRAGCPQCHSQVASFSTNVCYLQLTGMYSSMDGASQGLISH